ncbi:MAG: glycosyltransferase family 4 protein [Bacteroidetes bacterium]|nr:glycosyltransferase family 4 protein [Bacteroidota bacterium]
MARIVLIGSAHPLRGGGLATFNERLATAFMQMGHDVTIYTFSLQYPSFLFPGKTQYSNEPPPEQLDIKVKVNSINPFNWIKIGRELSKIAPDIVVLRYWIPFIAPSLGKISRIIRKNKKSKVVAIADNIIPHEKRLGDKLLTKYFVNSVDGFVILSQSVMQDLEKFNLSKPRKLCLHPLYDNFGDKLPKDKALKELSLDSDYCYLLFFGFIRAYKGLDLLLKAMAEPVLKNKKIKAIIAGEFYENPKEYIDLIEKLGIRSSVVLHNNFIPNNKVAAYFSAADLVVQPYKDATQSGVTQVAYHFNVPMVVTNVGALPEMVNHGKAGYVVEPDEKQIANAIGDFFENNRAGVFANTIIEEKKRFSWESLVNSIFEVYDKTRA